MKIAIQTILTLYKMLFIVMYACATLLAFYAITELLTLIYIIPLSILIIYVYVCTFKTLTFVDDILKSYDDNYLEVYECLEDIITDDVECYVFSKGTIYSPRFIYSDGIVFMDDNNVYHLIPYSFLEEKFKKILIKEKDA